MPGALPYFAAIDLILKEDLPLVSAGLALLYYNLVFVLPLAALLLIFPAAVVALRLLTS